MRNLFVLRCAYEKGSGFTYDFWKTKEALIPPLLLSAAKVCFQLDKKANEHAILKHQITIVVVVVAAAAAAAAIAADFAGYQKKHLVLSNSLQNSADVDSGHFEKEVLAEVAVAAAAAVDSIVAGGIALAEPDSDYFPPPVEML